jgi:hypothetical protein
MNVVATLHPHCALARNWRVRARPSGNIFGVHFHRRGLTYVTEPLDPPEAARLQHVPYVTIEATSVAPPASLQPAEPVTAPAAEEPAVAAPAAEEPVVKRGPGRPPRVAPAPVALISDEELFGKP